MSARWSLLPEKTPRSAFGKLVLNEFRLAWRQPGSGWVVGLGLPLLLMVIFGSIPKLQKHQETLGGLTFFDVYVPILIALAIAAIGLFSLPMPLATYREQGILRRLSTTPVPPIWVLGAQLVVNLCLAATAIILIMVVGTAGFDLKTPASPGGFVVAVLLSVVAIFGLGLLIADVARTATGAQALGAASFFPLMFFAELWVPRQVMPAVLRDISNLSPLGASVEAIQHLMQSGFPSATSLLVLAAYAILFCWLAVRFFGWE